MNNVADPIAHTLAGFTASMRLADVPAQVSLRARHLMLDAIGCALAARREDFASRFDAALRALAGPAPDAMLRGVIGDATGLPLRDAVVMNGILMHGLDYDDTHMAGIVHLTVAVLPAVLGLAAQRRASGADMLAAYIAAVECGARLAMAARGGFHSRGFHATGLVGAFAAALAAGRLGGLDAAQLVHAQGAVLSFASGSLQFIEDGAWTKRTHPGWAAQAGLVAASMAAHGVVAPQAPYSGRYGLYATHLDPSPARPADLSLATAGLDAQGHASEWELGHIAVKPFAMCHFVHAAADAAIALHHSGLDVADIEVIEVLVPDAAVELVCEPVERKRKPQNEYDAKFSLPYAVVSGLLRGRLGLRELLPEAYLAPDAQILMEKVRYRIDAEATFPRHYSGEVRVLFRDGNWRTHREAINRGHADRPVTNAEVKAKFMQNATLHFSSRHAAAVCDQVLRLDELDDVRVLEALLTQPPH